MRLSNSLRTPAWLDSLPLAKTPRYKETRVWAWGRQIGLGEVMRAALKFRYEMSAWLSSERVSLPGVGKLAESIALLQSRDSDAGSEEMKQEAPIFLLSIGWRAGSTLLQRVLVTDPRVLLWGEPLGDMALVSRIAEMVSNSLSPHLLRLWDQAQPGSTVLATSWIANLYPSTSDFRVALRSLFDQWLGAPARERGFSRWGFKEVRFGATEATLLHWLYPNAKFVVISRHPFDSYRSLAHLEWTAYYRFPDVRVDSAAGFARNWNRQAMSWSELPAGFPCFHVKYEDLISRKVDFRKLESWLGIELNENVALSAPVGVSAKRKSLTWYERLIIAREAETGMRALGYPI